MQPPRGKHGKRKVHATRAWSSVQVNYLPLRAGATELSTRELQELTWSSIHLLHLPCTRLLPNTEVHLRDGKAGLVNGPLLDMARGGLRELKVESYP